MQRFASIVMSLSSEDIARHYRQEARRMVGFFVRRTHDPEVALDLVAETFASAVRDRAQFRGRDDAAAVAWLYGIGRNLLGRWYRDGAVEQRAVARLGIQRAGLGEDEYDRLVELGGLAEARAAIAEQLRGLPADQRRAVELRVLEERSYDDVAAALSISQPTARARVSRGLRALAVALDGVPLDRGGAVQ
jgi:RNA polymerase sigma-70 factor (ECF subfamily)